MFDDVFKSVESKLADGVKTATDQAINRVQDTGQAQMLKLMGLASSASELTVTSDNGIANLQGLKHKQLSDLIKICSLGQPLMLVGMAGTGKTHAAEQVAEALKLKFYAMSVGAQTSKSDIIGFIHAGGSYVPTLFREAYEHGGIFLMDEIDAGNANVLIQINAALSNSYCAFPDKMVKRHDNFRFIGTANTFGNGANRMYVGRNQLDAATLDRFTLMEWEIDENLEAAMVASYAQGGKWHKAVKRVRKYAQDNDYRVLVTPRTTIRGAQLLNIGYDIKEAIKGAILNAVPFDKQHALQRELLLAWES